MKTTLKIEELTQLILGVFLFSLLDYSWWWFPVLILAPDIGAIVYLVNSKIGATIYKLFHNKAISMTMGLCGFYFENSLLILIGVILFSHAAVDRIFGSRLKYSDNFKNTHLGKIGK